MTRLRTRLALRLAPELARPAVHSLPPIVGGGSIEQPTFTPVEVQIADWRLDASGRPSMLCRTDRFERWVEVGDTLHVDVALGGWTL